MLKTVTLLILLAAAPAVASEAYVGHSVRGMSHPTTDSVVGVLIGDGFKAGVGKFGAARYAHVIAEASHKGAFCGVGVGLVGDHPRIDGHNQFTLTAGVMWSGFILRWLHFSNGADIFRNSDRAARQRNLGVDFLVIGLKF